MKYEISTNKGKTWSPCADSRTIKNVITRFNGRGFGQANKQAIERDLDFLLNRGTVDSSNYSIRLITGSN